MPMGAPWLVGQMGQGREGAAAETAFLLWDVGSGRNQQQTRTQHLAPTILRLSTLYPVPGTDPERASQETMRNRLER